MRAAAVDLRVLPPGLFRRRAWRVFERNLFVYRHVWIILISGFFEPIFYLFASRFGIGELVGNVTDGSGQPVDYVTFVAPALLAASAMNGAVYESTMNIFFKLRYAKTYDSMLSTPVEPFDIALGEIAFCLLRGALYAIGFMAIMWIAGLIHSPLGILALPAALLIGFSFAAVGMAATTFMTSWQHFDLVNLFVLVLFLFSATFYPVTVYPPALQALAQLSPLYHGVVIIRSLTLGTVGPGMLWHVGFLVVMGLIGLRIASFRLRKLLTP